MQFFRRFEVLVKRALKSILRNRRRKELIRIKFSSDFPLKPPAKNKILSECVIVAPFRAIFLPFWGISEKGIFKIAEIK